MTKISEVWDHYFAGRHDAVIGEGSAAAEIMHITGLSLIAVGRFDEASTLLISSALVRPNPEWYANACVAFLDADRATYALTFALTGMSEFPDDANLCFNAGNVFTALEMHGEARDALERAVHADPTHWEAAMNLANSLRRVGELKAALTFYDLALSLNGDDMSGTIRTKLNKAVTLSDLGYDEAALTLFESLAKDGVVSSPEMDFNRATLNLKMGNYLTGWELYERRWDCPMAKADKDKFLRPILTNLEEARGKHILFCHEQGFGDSIQFVRYAALFKDFEIAVTILVPEPLRRLFECFGFPVVTSRNDIEYDFECPMLSSPRLFRTSLDTIPSNDPYLTVPQELVEQRVPQTTGRLKVGIVWAGQSREDHEMKKIDDKRSIDITRLSGLLGRNADFISLQFGDRVDEYLELPPELQPIQILQPDFDFLDTAAVIQNLDLVIAVDTSTAHLAAALGKPTWILSRFDGCWRWLKYRTDSPWYPNVRIFSQPDRRGWVKPIAELEEALEALILLHNI